MSIGGGTLSVGTKFNQSFFSSSAGAFAVLGVATGVMYGFVLSYTPVVHGNISIAVEIGEYSTATTVANAAYVMSLRYGSGAGPITNAAQVGLQIAVLNTDYYPFASFATYRFAGAVSGLAVGTAYWFDIATTNLNTVTEAQASAEVFEF